MKAEIVMCDLCQRPLHGPGVASPQNKTGIVLGFDHSDMGWGHRECDINWSGEVCQTCYDEYKKILSAVRKWLEMRNGTQAPNISVTEREINVSTVQADNPPPGRRKAPLLSGLSYLLSR